MRPAKRVIIVGLLAVVVLAAYLVVHMLKGRDDIGILASGTIEATEAQLGFQVPGRIDFIGGHEGDTIKQGQLLANLDTRETQARLEQSRYQVTVMALRLAEARRDLARNKTLLAGGAIVQEAYDKTTLTVKVTSNEHHQAQAAVRVLEAALSNMAIRASFDGIITIRHHEPGEIVAAGAPVLTLMNPDDRWVRIYIAENHIGAVHLGQKTTISTDTWPGKHYSGTVTYIASQAEFTPKNVQTAEERVKLVYAVKVRITDDAKFELKPGMPADVHLDVPTP